MIKMIAVAIVAVFLIVFLKDYSGAYAMGIQIYACIFIALLLIPQLIALFNKVYILMDKINIDTQIPSTVFKLCGVTFISGISCKICNDNGNSSLSYLLECSSNLCILIIVFPLITQIIENIMTVLKNW